MAATSKKTRAANDRAPCQSQGLGGVPSMNTISCHGACQTGDRQCLMVIPMPQPTLMCHPCLVGCLAP